MKGIMTICQKTNSHETLEYLHFELDNVVLSEALPMSRTQTNLLEWPLLCPVYGSNYNMTESPSPTIPKELRKIKNFVKRKDFFYY